MTKTVYSPIPLARISGLFLWLFFFLPTTLRAEGSRDFMDRPGYRLFLDARDPQQFKVFAAEGEFIQVGASHVGLAGGFIHVYRPDGSLAATYDDADGGVGVIYNQVMETAGPTGGGSLNGNGYLPGTVPVSSGETGIWTVRFGYPVFQSANFGNLPNNAPWNRTADQPTTATAILAWDVTVSTGSPANQGGIVREGRLYTNEYLAIISQNGYSTSPAFYLLAAGGYLYRAEILHADPYRFPLSASAKGLMTADAATTYRSMNRTDVVRSADPAGWQPGTYYQYEPQAADLPALGVHNNKLFFNAPDTLMPETALTTDIFRNHTHETWLFTLPSPLEPVLDSFAVTGNQPDGTPCVPGALSYGSGATIHLSSSVAGTLTLSLDLDGNGSFADSVDRVLEHWVDAGANQLEWDALDGQGNALPPGEYQQLLFKADLRNGETHLLLSDVENNGGGVLLKLESDVKSAWFDQFFYDHTAVAGPASGNGSAGAALPTNQPYLYENNFGNNKVLDYWSFAYYPGVAFGFLDFVILIDCSTLLTADTDNDGIRDHLDIDDDNDGITDRWESCQPAGFDCLPGGMDPGADADTDGIPNYLDADDPALDNNCADQDDDGRCDQIPAAYDLDGDQIPNFLDPDSDGDGLSDLLESGHQQADADLDGMLDGSAADFGANGLFLALSTDPVDPEADINYTLRDGDADLLPDFLDIDRDNDGIPDASECETPPLCTDTDLDGTPDVDDLDSDADGLTDAVECPAGIACPDADGDGIPDWRDYTCHAGTPVAQLVPETTDTLLCAGLPLTLSASGSLSLPDSVTFAWTGPGGFSQSGQALATGPFPMDIAALASAGAGTYTLAVQTRYGCPSVPLAVEVQVSEALPLPVLTANDSMPCPGSQVLLEATSAGDQDVQFLWFFNGQLIYPTDTSLLVLSSPSPAQSGTYTVQTTDGVCYSEMSAGLDLQVTDIGSQAPQLALSDDALCEGETLVLSSAPVSGGEVTYEWYHLSGGSPQWLGATDQPTFSIPQVTVAQTGGYAVAVTVDGCASPISVPEAVLIGATLPVPPVLQVNDPMPCTGASLVFQATEYPGITVSYTWMGNGPAGPFSLGTTQLPQLTIDSATAANTGQYLVTVSTPGCSAVMPSAIVSVAVNSQSPPLPQLVAAATALCETDDLVLSATGPALPGILYEWFFDEGAGPVSLGITNEPTFVLGPLAPANSGSYLVQSSVNGCTAGLSEPVTVQVGSYLTTAPTLSASAAVHCQGETLVLNSSVLSGIGVSYQWYVDQGNGPVLLAETAVPTYIIPNLTPAASGQYLVVAASGACASQPSNIQLVEVTDMTGPAMSLSVSAETLCAGETLVLNSGIFPGVDITYVWQFDAGDGWVVLDSTEAPTLLLENLTADQAGLYAVVAYDGACATQPSNLQPVQVTVPPDLTATNSTEPDAPGCLGTPVQLETAILPGAVYAWSGPMGFTSAVPNPVLMPDDPAMAGSYSVIVSFQGCTMSAGPTTVRLYDMPQAEDDAFDIAASASRIVLPVLDNDLSEGGADLTLQLTADPRHGTADWEGYDLLYTPALHYEGPDVLTYEVCLADCPDQCDEATVRLQIIGQKGCFVPNVFTPNGDGANDRFRVPCLESRYPDNHVKVFNRWGDLVFEASEYQNDWDGRYKGTPLPPGTYFYIIQLEEGRPDNCLQGYVTIAR
ncbi:MAG: hypothetical protein RLY31_188 [Bacteroidota bacterium]